MDDAFGTVVRYIVAFGILILFVAMFSGRRRQRNAEKSAQKPDAFRDLAPGIDSFLKNPIGMIVFGVVLLGILLRIAFVFGRQIRM